MAALLNGVPGELEPPWRKRFTRREFDGFLNSGTFEGQRFELIDGDLIDKMGQNPPHAWAVRTLLRCLIRLFGVDRVQCQAPIEVAADDRELNYPEPDLGVFKPAHHECATRHPSGSEMTLLVEVADSSARLDRTLKAGLYARAGVPEYWVVDLNRRVGLYLPPSVKRQIHTGHQCDRRRNGESRINARSSSGRCGNAPARYQFVIDPSGRK